MPGLETTIQQQKNETAELIKKHPKLTEMYLAVLACLIVLSLVLTAKYIIDLRNQNEQEYLKVLAQLEYEAQQDAIAREQQAAIIAEQRAEAARRDEEAILLAKFFAGVDGFVQNYGYSSDDLYTYAQCPLNRVLNPAFACSTIEESLMQEGQWVGFSMDNQVLPGYYKLAKTIIAEFYNNELRPCSNKYCWAELRRDGVWLNDDFGNRYAHTWRYSSL